MNARKVQPVTFWSPEGSKEADTLLLYNFHGYDFNGTNSMVSYKLGVNETIGEQEKFVSLSEGSVSIPDSVVQAWGEDDEPIFNYVVDKLNLIRE